VRDGEGRVGQVEFAIGGRLVIGDLVLQDLDARAGRSVSQVMSPVVIVADACASVIFPPASDAPRPGRSQRRDRRPSGPG
jgi:hypothetical protein